MAVGQVEGVGDQIVDRLGATAKTNEISVNVRFSFSGQSSALRTAYV
jgi:hypothetical protein